MKKPNKSLLLLIALLPIILANCPDYPASPTTPLKLITPASPGMEHYPTSTQQLSIAMFITPEAACSELGSAFNVFSLDVTPPGGGTQQYLKVDIVCDNLNFRLSGSLRTTIGTLSPSFPSGFGPFALFLAFDLSIDNVQVEIRSESYQISAGYALSSSGLSFDSNSKFYFCANQDGDQAQSCTVSKLTFDYRYYGFGIYGHLAGDPDIAAFYPLTSGSLATSIGSASPAYFGDDEADPADTTKPTWDSSNNFVTITAGQFLTFPLPDISSALLATSYDFSFSAWVKILTPIPSATTTIFAMYSSTGDQVGYRLQVDKATQKLSVAFKSSTGAELQIYKEGTAPVIALDTWQLIVFTPSSNTDQKSVVGTLFCGTSSSSFYYDAQTSPYDLSTASVIRIGDTSSSFNGHISIVRITAPGGGFVKSTDLCSSDNSLELGAGSFALACSGDKALSPADNTCIASCGNKAYKATETGTPLCVACSDHCTECDSTGCLVCEADYLKYDGGCVKPCPDKTYSDGESCQSCSDTTCKTCDDKKCLTCETGDFLYQESCVDSCPPKTYSTEKTCETCSDHCTECTSSGCKTCENGYELNASKKCVSKSSPTTPSREEAGSSSGGLSDGAIAGIVCGSVAIVFLAGWFIFCCKTRKFPFARSKTRAGKNPVALEVSNPVSPMHTEAHALVP